MTDSTGVAQRRYDYQPFGQEILAGYDGRTQGYLYLSTPDDTDPKFTGQDRDVETGLDWFQVRHMSGAAGRFQGVDPGNAGADSSNPQTWNGYSYVANNPLSFTDPSGMIAEAGGDSGGDGGGDGLAGVIVAGIEAIFQSLFGGGGPPPTISPSLVTPSSPILGSVYTIPGLLFFAEGIGTEPTSVASSVGGGATGFGSSLGWATIFNNRTSRAGQAKLGRPLVGNRRFNWERSFHFDGPHGPVRFPHINAEFGPLRALNHQESPSWLYSLGSTRNLRIISGSALVLGVSLDAYSIATAPNRCQAIWGVAGGWVGGAAGAAGGSVFAPGAGTVLGGAAGGVAGGLLGDQVGQRVCH